MYIIIFQLAWSKTNSFPFFLFGAALVVCVCVCVFLNVDSSSFLHHYHLRFHHHLNFYFQPNSLFLCHFIFLSCLFDCCFCLYFPFWFPFLNYHWFVKISTISISCLYFYTYYYAFVFNMSVVHYYTCTSAVNLYCKCIIPKMISD